MKIKLIALVILIAIFAIASLSSCSTPKTGIETIQAIQKELNYTSAMGRNESFTIASYKEDLASLKKKIKEANKSDIDEKKRYKLLKEIEELRSRL